MTREGTSFWEDHSPGDLSDTTVELPIDEITNSPQTQSDRGSDNEEVGDLPERLSVPQGKKNPDNEDADQPAMKRHAAVPDGKDLKGIPEIHFKIVEKDISQTGPDD